MIRFYFHPTLNPAKIALFWERAAWITKRFRSNFPTTPAQGV